MLGIISGVMPIYNEQILEKQVSYVSIYAVLL